MFGIAEVANAKDVAQQQQQQHISVASGDLALAR
jgi:hypothetical protein